jgi:class 3 adenylate cyclase/tetratricopeptide (TPR) repeat protein
MSFLNTVRRAKAYLEEQGRVSLRALRREFGLDDDALDELVQELVDVQQVAAREGKFLSWVGPASAAASAAPPFSEEGERRQLTVLFCDLVGSTQLAADLDPEDWREVVRGYQEVAAQVVEASGGHVAQYLGDGLLVYFGYPTAHESDAEHAVRAGLGLVEAVAQRNPQLQARHGVQLAVRIGIHTGPVVVAEMGRGASRERLAMGETTNVAAHLQAVAAPNRVCLSAATLRLIHGVFQTCDLGLRELKAGRQIHAHEAERVIGTPTGFDRVAPEQPTTFVGREPELGVVQECWARAREGHGQAVLISGDPGIGKSRLVHEFRTAIAAQPHAWLEGRCSPYAQESPLDPVLGIQRRSFGFRARDTAEQKIERIEATLRSTGFDFPDAVPLLADLHSLPLPADRYRPLDLEPEGRRRRTLELLGQWVLGLGRAQPVVIVLEDVHWMDPSTAELLAAVLERSADERILLLLTGRPEFDPSGGPPGRLTTLVLERLDAGQVEAIVRDGTRGHELPAGWVGRIAERSDGIPLFAEELTRAAVETDAAWSEAGDSTLIPSTLRDSLMARLDRLGPARELAQLAAVAGRELSHELLERIALRAGLPLDPALQRVLDEGVFLRHGAPPEASYSFRHALIQDTAYESLLRTTRRRYHLLLASALREDLPEIAESRPELVAHHLTRAGESVGAVEWWLRAAELAHRRAANEEAIGHLRRGLRIVAENGGGEDREFQLQRELCRVLAAARGYSHQETEAAYWRTVQLLQHADDPTQAGVVLCGHANVGVAGGRLDQAYERYGQMIDLCRGRDLELVELAGRLGQGIVLFFRSELPAAVETFAWGAARYDPARHAFVQAGFPDNPGVEAHHYGGWALWYAGYPEQARRSCERAIEVAPDRFSVAYSLAFRSALENMTRDYEPAEATAREALRLADRDGFPYVQSLAGVMRCAAYGRRTRDSAAEADFIAIVRNATQGGSATGAPLVLGDLAELQILLGRLAEARSTLELARTFARERQERVHVPELHRLTGELALAADEPDAAAERAFVEAVELARSQHSRSLELRATTSLARLWQRQGRNREARDTLAPVYAWFQEGFDCRDLVDARNLLETLGGS